MRKIGVFKYVLVLTLPATVAVSFVSTNAFTYLPLLYAFGLVPLIELLLQPDPSNLRETEREVAKDDRRYDAMVRLMVPIQYAFVVWFFFVVQEEGLSGFALAGRITALGMMCGVIGINVAHELGHRIRPLDRMLSKCLLVSSLYAHFYIEHNRGHHRHVATPNDPATARRNEMIYIFWLRSIVGAWLSAWHIEAKRLKAAGKPWWSMQNEMLRLQLIQVAVVIAVALLFGVQVAFYFVLAAFMGGLLLETVNYIEHYGLLRKANAEGRYERVMPKHSWNSNHVYGRLLLFELSRHSDHHYKASTPYQLLDHIDDAPQLPTGYPGMMLLALVPPLFFSVMNRRVDKLQEA